MAAALEKLLLYSVQGSFAETPLCGELGIYSKDLDSCRLALQLQMLPDLVSTYNNLNPSTPIN